MQLYQQQNLKFSANDRVVIKNWDTRNDTALKIHRRNPNKPKTLKQIAADGTIKRKHASWWMRAVSKNEEFIDEAVKQWCPRLRVCIRAHWGHFEHNFREVWYLHTHVHFGSHVSVRLIYAGQSMSWGDRIEPPAIATIACVDRFYWNSLICLQLDVALFWMNKWKICIARLKAYKCILNLQRLAEKLKTKTKPMSKRKTVRPGVREINLHRVRQKKRPVAFLL